MQKNKKGVNISPNLIELFLNERYDLETKLNKQGIVDSLIASRGIDSLRYSLMLDNYNKTILRKYKKIATISVKNYLTGVVIGNFNENSQKKFKMPEFIKKETKKEIKISSVFASDKYVSFLINTIMGDKNKNSIQVPSEKIKNNEINSLNSDIKKHDKLVGLVSLEYKIRYVYLVKQKLKNILSMPVSEENKNFIKKTMSWLLTNTTISKIKVSEIMRVLGSGNGEFTENTIQTKLKSIVALSPVDVFLIMSKFNFNSIKSIKLKLELLRFFREVGVCFSTTKRKKVDNVVLKIVPPILNIKYEKMNQNSRISAYKIKKVTELSLLGGVMKLRILSETMNN